MEISTKNTNDINRNRNPNRHNYVFLACNAHATANLTLLNVSR